MIKSCIPQLQTDNIKLNKAFRIAIGDLLGNIKEHKSGILNSYKPCIMAGLDYNRPWTRDTAINIWNGCSLIIPEISYNTLISVIENRDNNNFIGGQYWDAIIWTTGAWWHYLYTGDKDFLKLSFEVTKNSISYFEKTEFDENINLFRGPACYGDGVSAYPDEYANAGGNSGILDWVKFNINKKAKIGYGLPMFTLSTNCLYYNMYKLLINMQKELHYQTDILYKQKALKLKNSINKNFWNDKTQKYKYIIGPLGESDFFEGIGNSFVILFDIANENQAEMVIKNQYISPNGIPCIWPLYSRYQLNEESFGRHNGTVWPPIQGFWSSALLKYKQYEAFNKEYTSLTNNINRDVQCAEIYHPNTGKMYGGIQERSGKGIKEWRSCNRQTWSATAYLRIVLFGLCGLRLNEKEICFQPYIPRNVNSFIIKNLNYRNMKLNISIINNGTDIKKFKINNKIIDNYFLSASENGEKNIEIFME